MARRAVASLGRFDHIERWPDLMRERVAHVHLYGKDEPRPGRKMGHVTRVKR